ncbi:isocitrate lyase/PEP mutase family protein, partial [Psychromarinibacter halotolerans]
SFDCNPYVHGSPTRKELTLARAATTKMTPMFCPLPIEISEMVQKIEAATSARRSDDFLIIARTDAIATGGIDEAVARARAYEAAGADVIFPDAVRGADDIARIVEAVSIPVRINMGFGLRTRTTTPLMSVPALEALGVRWVSLSRLLPASAINGMKAALSAMRDSIEKGEPVSRPDLVADMSDIQDIMNYAEFFDIEARFADARHSGEAQ